MKSIDRDKLGDYLSAYLDDELTDEERRALERLIARDEATRRQFEELRETTELVRGLPRGAAPSSLVESLTAAAERRQLLGEPEEVVLPHRPWWQSARTLLSAAAVLLITVVGAWYVFDAMNLRSGTQVVDRSRPAAEERLAPETTPRMTPAPGEPSPEGKTAAVPPPQAETAAASAPRFAEGEPAEAKPGERGGAPLSAAAKGAVADSAANSRPQSTAKKGGTVAPLAPAEPGGISLSGMRTGGTAASLAPEEPGAHGGDDAALQAERHRQTVVSATLAEKLSAGVPASEIVEHPFANEANQLQVFASDADDELRARQQVAGFAVSNRLSDLSLLDPSTTPAANEGLFFEGRAKHNYADPNQQQFVVRIPRNEVGELVGMLRTNPANPAGVRPLRLAVGPLGTADADEALALAARIGAPVSDQPGLGGAPGATRLEGAPAAATNLEEAPAAAIKSEEAPAAAAEPEKASAARTKAESGKGPEVSATHGTAVPSIVAPEPPVAGVVEPKKKEPPEADRDRSKADLSHRPAKGGKGPAAMNGARKGPASSGAGEEGEGQAAEPPPAKGRDRRAGEDYSSETPRDLAATPPAVPLPSSQPVEPGRLVDRLESQLSQRGAEPAAGAEPGPDEFITVVVQVLQTDVDRPPATQPEETGDE